MRPQGRLGVLVAQGKDRWILDKFQLPRFRGCVEIYPGVGPPDEHAPRDVPDVGAVFGVEGAVAWQPWEQ